MPTVGSRCEAGQRRRAAADSVCHCGSQEEEEEEMVFMSGNLDWVTNDDRS